MNLSDLKNALKGMETVTFRLPNGEQVPSHYHITEVGESTKRFIDCGGTVREKKTVTLQLWTAQDFDHRLTSEKLLSIIELSQDKLGIENNPVEVEYQGSTIETFGLDHDGQHFLLTGTETACLALDVCCPPSSKDQPVMLQSLNNNCAPGSGCC